MITHSNNPHDPRRDHTFDLREAARKQLGIIINQSVSCAIFNFRGLDGNRKNNEN